MAAPEVYGSGTEPQRSDTKRMLWAKRVREMGGTPTQADTQRLLKAKVARLAAGLSGTNSGV